MYFCAFNFHTSQAVRKYFNNKIFVIYGTLFFADEETQSITTLLAPTGAPPLTKIVNVVCVCVYSCAINSYCAPLRLSPWTRCMTYAAIVNHVVWEIS